MLMVPARSLCVMFIAAMVQSGTAAAQGSMPGIDCSKARSSTERAICADPGLIGLDRSAAQAYSDASTRAPAQRATLRQEQLRWLKQRDAACALPAPAITACLKAQLTARIAALAPTPLPAQIPTQIPAQTPVATRRAPPSIPSTAIPRAAATLDRTSLPAAPQAETLLHVTSPGRFSLTAKSAGGAALQLVDMLTGPSDVAGAAGSQDGRIDELLDVGDYKVLVLSAPGASGAVALEVQPFHDAAAPAALPQPGEPLSTTLADGEQRAFWLAVPASGTVRIEAAGRALADLRLWRDGRELSGLQPQTTSIEPSPGHRLTDVRLIGQVEPGTYLAVAYGGRAASWTDGDASQPFHLRAGLSEALKAGWAEGQVGPFGSEVFQRPPTATLLTLALPKAEAAELSVGAHDAAIDRNSREPTTRLALAADEAGAVELRAAQGQRYTLRALDRSTATSLRKPGTYWLSAVAEGAGGDAVPPTLLLLRDDGSTRPARIVADTLPTLGPTTGWRTGFNLRGPTTLFAHSLGGPVTLRSTGVATQSARGEDNLPEGYFAFTLRPQPGAFGAVEVTLGAPGLAPPLAEALPRDPVLPFGVQTLAPGEQFRLLGNTAPGVTIGLAARPAPVALAEGPLAITLAALASTDVPVSITPGGTLEVTEIGRGRVPYTSRAAAGGIIVTVPPADHARTVVLSWRRAIPPAAAIPAPAPLDQRTDMQAGTPTYFDLANQQSASFGLSVATGGLYRIETTGRLRTAGRLGTAFLPEIATGEANGVGQNMLVQTMLRAGRYRISVTAEDSAGHAGLVATPAPLLTTAAVAPGGTVRASLPAGTGAAIPIDVAAAATLHFDLLSLGAAWSGRLEDEQGWPLTRPGPLDGLERRMAAGPARLLIEPSATAREVVVRLRTLEEPVAIVGHGPHALPFGAAQAATWREPDSQSAPRTPDQWRFTLDGAATVALTLDTTMVGELRGPAGSVQRVVGSWRGTLPPGGYQLDVTSLGRNDRAAYTVALDSIELQPDRPRQVTLPATVPFAIDTPRVVSLTSFGTTPLRAVLRDAGRHVIGRYGPREDDWNIAVSRPLPAGAYTLDLAAATAPTVTATEQRDAPQAADNDATTDNSADDGMPDAQTIASQTAKAKATSAVSDDADAPAASDDDSHPAVTTEIRLTLPPTLGVVAASAAVATLEGSGVHVLSLPAPAPGQLLVAQAQSAAELVLSLERRGMAGWEVVALDQGRMPAVAAPGDADPAEWRVQAWLVDGGAEPVRAAARAVAAEARPAGDVTLTALDGMAGPLAVARLALPAGLASVRAADEVRMGSRPGRGLAPVVGAVSPVAGDVWLLGPAGAARVEPMSPAAGETIALTVPEGFGVSLPAGDGPQLWLARAGTGQASLGAATGWAPGSVIALAGSAVSLQGGAGPQRVDLRRVALKLAAPVVVDTALQLVLPAGGAVAVTLPPGAKRLDLVLAAGTGAVPGWHAPKQIQWAGDAPVSRSVTGDWTDVLLVNPGPNAAPVMLATVPAPADNLAPGAVHTRFFGAAGSFETAVTGAEGGRLRLAGPGTLTLIDAAGRIASGPDLPLTSAGRAIVEHAAGALALWVEAPGASPWPNAPLQPLALPAHVALSGASAAFGLHADGPALIHVSTTAPVVLRIGDGQPALYPAGAELDRVLAAGGSALRLFPLGDGALTGSLALRAAPILPVGEGLGPETIVSPGGAAAFGFSLDHPATVGVGLRADPDRATARLLDEAGRVVGTGVAQLVALTPGRYVLEAQVPPDAPATTLRPAIVGIAKRGNGPPPDVVRDYLELAGMKPQGNVP